MDALSDILKATRWTAKVYFSSAGQGPWCMQVLYRPQGVFHAVLKGRCYLRERGGPDAIVLEEGDVVAFPTGGDHKISGTQEGLKLAAKNVIRLTDNDEVMVLKQGAVSFSQREPDEHASESVVWLTGTMSYDTSIAHPLLKELPCSIVVGKDNKDASQVMQSVVSVLVSGGRADAPGSTLTIDRMSEVLFLQMLQCYVQSSTHSSGYFAALADPQIGVALNLVHNEDDGSLTVESLCSAAAMSRTKFNARFKQLVGETPKAYLTNTRLLRAITKLQHSQESIQGIALAAGYSSDSSFSKAVKNRFGMAPGEFRKADLQ
ncbi:MAG: AraC family transcriptional regulator [Halieaceae bacterium]|nr:AraC family transcriptional regulator [Halieaceae bacterium]MCP4468539.1 AraC family transcriptional regulator [Halieaceae bacterium]MCP4842520.1 AraC family transcriptional regulator [Halieaceae bacterium]